MPLIDLTEEELEHLSNCLAGAALIALPHVPFPKELPAKLGEALYKGIIATTHRTVLHKINPEKAAQVDAILAKLKSEPYVSDEERKNAH